MKVLVCFIRLIVIMLCLGGCARMAEQSTSVMLQHPETMDFVKCDVDQWGTKKSFAKNEQCIKEYKSKGYVIWAKR